MASTIETKNVQEKEENLGLVFSDLEEENSDGSNHTESSSEEEENDKKPFRKRCWTEPEGWEPSEREKELNADLFGDRVQLIKNLDGKTFFLDTGADREAKPEPAAVWHDSDDESTTVDNQNNKLKKKFERIAGNPAWADLNHQPELDSDEEIVKTVGHLSQSKKTSQFLGKDVLIFKKLPDLNRSSYSEGNISSVQFHPSSSVGIVTGRKGCVSIYSIDGRENKKIHSMLYDKYSIECCRLNGLGDELILGGINDFFHTYNLLSGHKQRIRLPKEITTLKSFKISPCGKFMAIVGRFGELHLLNTTTKELITTFKQEFKVSDLEFTTDSSKIYSHSKDSEVTIFDIRTQRALHRFIDDGCVNGRTVSVSPNGHLLATGSRQGVVNIYKIENVVNNKYPKPEKAITNLTTSIQATAFNATSEILAICSNDLNDAIRLVHLPSANVFKNFPTQQARLGHLKCLAFSPSSGYLGLGNSRSQVPLFRLRHYANY